jgi:hypothetical protein
VLTPASSSSNLKQQQQPAVVVPATALSNKSSAASMRFEREGSDKSSHRSKIVPAPIPVSHVKAATTPTSGNSYDTIPSTSSSAAVDDMGILSGMSPISESPTRSFSSSPPQSPDFNPSAIGRTQTHQTFNPHLLNPATRDSDSISLISTNGNGGEKKKSKWRRGSSNKKPTGLAGAIAASGLAMANPAMTAPQAAQIQTQIQTSPTISPTKQNGTRRKLSTGSHRHFTSASASALSIGSDPPRRTRTHTRIRTRTGSVSNRSDNNSEGMYDSGLEDISSDGEGGSQSGSDDDDDELDLHNDIPVTGFAVASNKRNADFHDLFSNIPDGDYLIEGGFFYLGWGLLMIMIFHRLWMCVAEGDIDTRPYLHLGEPHMFPRQHLRMDNRRTQFPFSAPSLFNLKYII